MWLIDLFLSLPQLPVLLLVIYLFRPALKACWAPQGGVFVLIVVVIGGFRWMPLARLVRAQFLSLREKEFVEAARALGASRLRLVVRHIMPNALGPVIVAGTIEVANAIIAESTLSFLGLGFPPDVPSWGRMLFDAKDNLDIAPHWALFPGWRSSSRCCRSTSSATGCAMRSTRGGWCNGGALNLSRLRRERSRREAARVRGVTHGSFMRHAPHPRRLRAPRPLPPQAGEVYANPFSKFAISRPGSAPTTAWCARWTASISRSIAARRWPWSASPAAARPSPRAAC